MEERFGGALPGVLKFASKSPREPVVDEDQEETQAYIALLRELNICSLLSCTEQTAASNGVVSNRLQSETPM